MCGSRGAVARHAGGLLDGRVFESSAFSASGHLLSHSCSLRVPLPVVCVCLASHHALQSRRSGVESADCSAFCARVPCLGPPRPRRTRRSLLVQIASPWPRRSHGARGRHPWVRSSGEARQQLSPLPPQQSARASTDRRTDQWSWRGSFSRLRSVVLAVLWPSQTQHRPFEFERSLPSLGQCTRVDQTGRVTTQQNSLGRGSIVAALRLAQEGGVVGMHSQAVPAGVRTAAGVTPTAGFSRPHCSFDVRWSIGSRSAACSYCSGPAQSLLHESCENGLAVDDVAADNLRSYSAARSCHQRKLQ